MNEMIENLRKDKENQVLTRLQMGDVIEVGSEGRHLVFRVNDCRACCLPLEPKRVEFQPRFSDKKVAYDVYAKMISISPSAEYPIVQRMGKAGMITFLENQQKQKQERKHMSKNSTKTTKTETKEQKPHLGRLGGFLGYPITAVIRAMALAGWEFWEVRMVCDEHKVPVKDNTIRIQLSWGRSKFQPAAPVNAKELKALRPDPSLKPARKNSKPKAEKAKKEVAAADDGRPTKKTKATEAMKKARKAREEDAGADPEPEVAPRKARKPAPVEDEQPEDPDGE